MIVQKTYVQGQTRELEYAMDPLNMHLSKEINIYQLLLLSFIPLPENKFIVLKTTLLTH